MIITREIRAQLDELHVTKASALAGEIADEHGQDDKGPTTQVGKAAKVAETCGSMVVFEQWLRYQAGRGVAPWKKRTGNTLLVDRVLQHQRDIAERLERIAAAHPPDTRKKLAAGEMARFLGFLRRALIARKAGG